MIDKSGSSPQDRTFDELRINKRKEVMLDTNRKPYPMGEEFH